MFTSLPLLLSLSIGSISAIADCKPSVLHPGFTLRYKDAGMFGSTPFIIQTTNDSGAGYQSAHYTKARFQLKGRLGWRLVFGVAVVSTFSYCSIYVDLNG